MPSIAVPRQFFEKERDTVYGSWTTAFWREFLSNCLDADASRIIIRTAFNEAGEYVVDVVDDGHGMDRDTVENVYMCLGKSTKDADGTGIGGFGRARVLTCFSQLGYKIRSRDCITTGSGATYDVAISPKPLSGCAVTVRVDPIYAQRLQRGLRQVLVESNLEATVSLILAKETPDGVSLAQMDGMTTNSSVANADAFSGWKSLGNGFRTLSDDIGPWAHVYAQDTEVAGYTKAIVRVGGMAMYVDPIKSGAEIVVELVPERSREVMTANRDGLRDDFRGAMNALYAELAIDGESATVVRDRQVCEIYHAEFAPAGLRMPGSDVGGGIQPDLDNLAGRVAHYMNPRLPVGLRVSNASEKQIEASSKWTPDAWRQPGATGRNAELLHAAWTGACRHALTELCKIRPDLRFAREWATGFVIDENFGGMHAAIADVDHVILLNPVDSQGHARYKISDPASMKKMIAIAIHEVTHVAYSYHDEAYAGLFTELVGAIRDKDIEAEMKREMDDCRAFQKGRDETFREVLEAVQVETPGRDVSDDEREALIQKMLGKPVDSLGSSIAKNDDMTLSPSH
jgi:hypothetical protein